jgi:hypothetical protein
MDLFLEVCAAVTLRVIACCLTFLFDLFSDVFEQPVPHAVGADTLVIGRPVSVEPAVFDALAVSDAPADAVSDAPPPIDR